MTHRFTVSCALLTLMSVVACGSDSENGGSSGTGGTAPGSTGGDTAASGGDTAASGGDTSTTGGAPGTGGVVQGGGGMDDSMKLAWYLGIVTMTLLLPPLLLWLRSRLAQLQAQLEHTWQEALTRGIVDYLDEHEASEREALHGAQEVR